MSSGQRLRWTEQAVDQLGAIAVFAAMGLTWVALPRSQRWARVFGSAAVIGFVMSVAAIMAG